MLLDHVSDYLNATRSSLYRAVSPIIIIADYPSRSAVFFGKILSSRADLLAETKQMESELLLLRARVARMAELANENTRLRGLVGVAEKLQDKVLAAEVVGIEPDPLRHEVIIDKGSNNNVFVGQSVLDAGGLLGQVVKVSPAISRVLLITDRSHLVPVSVVRNNLRLTAEGSGVTQQLKLLHVSNTADINKGDLLVTSGFGNRFPVGYPVGKVSSVKHDSTEPFANVMAIPSAQLTSGRHLLLVFSEEKPPAALGEVGPGGQ